MEAPVLESASSDIEAIVKKKTIRTDVPPLLEGVERDIRLNVHPPFDMFEVQHLSSFVHSLLEQIFEHLASLQANVAESISLPVAFQRLQERGEGILDDLKPYRMLAEHHFKEDIGRLERPTDEASREIYELANKAKELKERIVTYLQELSKYLADADINT